MNLVLIIGWLLAGVKATDDVWQATCPLKKTPCMCQPVGDSALCCHISTSFELNESLNCPSMFHHFLIDSICRDNNMYILF